MNKESRAILKRGGEMTKHEILEKIIVKAQACKELKMNPKDVDLFCDEISVLATELQEWLRKPKTKRMVKEFHKTENKPCKWDSYRR